MVPSYLHQVVPVPWPITKGRYILGGLFYETTDLPTLLTVIVDDFGVRPVFTLKTYDHTIPPESKYFRPDGCNRLASLHQLFVLAEDPSEYNFAMSTFGSFEHWEALTECAFFAPYLKRMRKTLEIRLDAKTVLVARRAMETGQGNVALQAAKWLNSRVVKTGKGRGRPSNDEVEQELKRQAEETKILNDDLLRIQ